MVKNSNMKTFQITIPKHLRLGQVLFNFLAWMKTYENISSHEENCCTADPFYLSDDEMINLWHRYLNFIHAYERKSEQEEE